MNIVRKGDILCYYVNGSNKERIGRVIGTEGFHPSDTEELYPKRVIVLDLENGLRAVGNRKTFFVYKKKKMEMIRLLYEQRTPSI